jgi:RNA polymerase sigma-70 factor, ECF subfamily
VDFETVMRENGPLIYTLAVRLTGNAADGQDLAQETFVKAYENFSRFREESAASTWLYRICVNLWKNRVRYEKRRFFWKHFSLDGKVGDDGAPTELMGTDRPLEAVQEGTDQDALVQQALAQLKPEDRALLVMCDMDDRSYEEISELLDIPLGTVKSRIARSRERLRQILEPIMKELR